MKVKTLLLDTPTAKVLWAAMLAMVHDIHAAQDNLSAEDWEHASRLYVILNDIVDAHE